MGLTQVEILLIHGLKLFEISKESMQAILLALESEEDQIQMIDYMMNNKNATEQDILQELWRLRGI